MNIAAQPFYTHNLTAKSYVHIRRRLYRIQDGRCACCGNSLSLGRPVLDHSHETGNIRGLVCHGCNSRIGIWEHGLDIINISTHHANQIMHYLDRTDSK